MKKSTLFDLGESIALVEAGLSKEATNILKRIYAEYAKEDCPWKPMSMRPAPGVRVDILFTDNSGKEPWCYSGCWNGEKWLIRKPYSKNEFEDAREGMIFLAWR